MGLVYRTLWVSFIGLFHRAPLRVSFHIWHVYCEFWVDLGISGVLQCVAVCCSVGNRYLSTNSPHPHAAQHTATHCNTLLECWSALQCVAVWAIVIVSFILRNLLLQCVAVCCSVLQCVAVCCSVGYCNWFIHSPQLTSYMECAGTDMNQALQHTCSVLQCVAVCCSVGHCHPYIHSTRLTTCIVCACINKNRALKHTSSVLKCAVVCGSVLQDGLLKFINPFSATHELHRVRRYRHKRSTATHF